MMRTTPRLVKHVTCLCMLGCAISSSTVAGQAILDLNKTEIPNQWKTTGDARESYRLRTARTVALSGAACAVLIADEQADPIHFGALVQAASAASFRGKRVEFSGFIASENAPAGAAIWLRADDAYGVPVAFENTYARGIRGTEAWTYQEIVMDVPTTAAVIVYGALLHGSGALFVDDLRFRIVDERVAVTARPLPAARRPAGSVNAIPSGPLPEPRNLDFEFTAIED